ncbi:MAG: 30S ribosome-binding factor RbfA [Pseudomonadota bacterium]
MRRSYPRSDRISDALHRQIALIVQNDLCDPRLRLVTIQGVRLSRDMSSAFVSITALTAEEQTAAKKVLTGAAGRIRTLIAKQLPAMRRVPSLVFETDGRWIKEAHIDALLRKVAVSEE